MDSAKTEGTPEVIVRDSVDSVLRDVGQALGRLQAIAKDADVKVAEHKKQEVDLKIEWKIFKKQVVKAVKISFTELCTELKDLAIAVKEAVVDFKADIKQKRKVNNETLKVVQAEGARATRVVNRIEKLVK